MMNGRRIAFILGALVALAIGIALRPSQEPPAPSEPVAPAAAEPAPGQHAADSGDEPVRSPVATAQLDAKQQSELEVTARISGELNLSVDERAAVEAAIQKLQTGRREQFARVMDGRADEREVTAGLHALHLAFEADLDKALGPDRGGDFMARFNAAYGNTFEDKKKPN